MNQRRQTRTPRDTQQQPEARTAPLPYRRLSFRFRLPLGLLLVLTLALGSFFWQRTPHPAQAQSPTVTLDPSSGLAGSAVSISATDFPPLTNQHSASIIFNLPGQPTVVGQQLIAECTTTPGTRTFGFGTLCTGTAVTFTVPATATPGPYQVTVLVTRVDTNTGQYSQAAPFTVLAPDTATPSTTPTGTATSTATATNTPAATATGTAQPTSTSTITQTPAPNVPTSTFTPVPNATFAALPTATVTATPKPVTALVLVKPAFARGTLLLSMVVTPAAKIHIVFSVGHGKAGQTVTDYTVTNDGTASASGRYFTLLHIAYHKAGQATLTITVHSGTLTRVATRHYPGFPG